MYKMVNPMTVKEEVVNACGCWVRMPLPLPLAVCKVTNDPNEYAGLPNVAKVSGSSQCFEYLHMHQKIYHN